MAVLNIPVNSEVAAYSFTIELERVIYLFRFRFNFRKSRWMMDIATRDGINIVVGVPMVSAISLFDRFKNPLLPPGDFMVYDTTGKLNSPGFSDFGKTIQLLYFESGTLI